MKGNWSRYVRGLPHNSLIFLEFEMVKFTILLKCIPHWKIFAVRLSFLLCNVLIQHFWQTMVFSWYEKRILYFLHFRGTIFEAYPLLTSGIVTRVYPVTFGCMARNGGCTAQTTPRVDVPGSVQVWERTRLTSGSVSWAAFLPSWLWLLSLVLLYMAHWVNSSAHYIYYKMWKIYYISRFSK